MSQNLALNLFIIENAVLLYFAYKNREKIKAYAKAQVERVKAKFK